MRSSFQTYISNNFVVCARSTSRPSRSDGKQVQRWPKIIMLPLFRNGWFNTLYSTTSMTVTANRWGKTAQSISQNTFVCAVQNLVLGKPWVIYSKYNLYWARRCFSMHFSLLLSNQGNQPPCRKIRLNSPWLPKHKEPDTETGQRSSSCSWLKHPGGWKENPARIKYESNSFWANNKPFVTRKWKPNTQEAKSTFIVPLFSHFLV